MWMIGETKRADHSGQAVTQIELQSGNQTNDSDCDSDCDSD